jgi:hypothetical protein
MPRGRAADYTREELVHFLDIASSIKPKSQTDWERVLDLHNVEYAYKNRSVESLRRKFAFLHRKKIPTGDPDCPVEVRLAKRLKYPIGARADMGDGAEELNLSQGTLNGAMDDAEDPEDDAGDDIVVAAAADDCGNNNNVITDFHPVDWLVEGVDNDSENSSVAGVAGATTPSTNQSTG